MIDAFYKIDSKGFREIKDANLDENIGVDSILIHYLKADKRNNVWNALPNDIQEMDFLDQLQKPDEHLRFEFVGDAIYGELAFFSPDSDQLIKYLGLVARKNTLFVIQDEDGDNMLSNIFSAFGNSPEIEISKFGIEQVLYVLILEMLTAHSKLILKYRDDIENFAKEFNNEEFKEIDPKDFLKAKSKLSDFSRVLEKIHFSLNFPPTKSVLNPDSAYRTIFRELLKTIDLLKISLKEAEDRLESLHDHYLLLLQEKSNKRINFLTIIQSIFAPLTLVVGIYGMNFKYMPELEYKYAYFIALGGMAIIAAFFIRYFYKHDWFK